MSLTHICLEIYAKIQDHNYVQQSPHLLEITIRPTKSPLRSNGCEATTKSATW